MAKSLKLIKSRLIILHVITIKFQWILEFLLPVMMRTRTRFTLRPRKITRLDPKHKKITTQTLNNRQCMTVISGAGETNKGTYTENTQSSVSSSLHGEEDPKQRANNSPALQETVQSSRTP